MRIKSTIQSATRTPQSASVVARRDFLLLRASAGARFAELSCERLYMRYVDAQADGDVEDMFARLSEDMRGVDALRLTDTDWLSCDDLRARLDAAIANSGVRATTVSDT